MINCLVAAATSLEIAPFMDHYRSHPDFNKKSVDVLITGIGLMASTYNLQKQIHLKRPDLVIQAGIAGCFQKTINLGQLLCVKHDIVADQGVVEDKKFRTLFDLKLVSPRQFPFKKGWLSNPHSALLKETKLKNVRGLSVNQITTAPQTARFYQQHFQAAVESMEGAALHYVCLMENIPFLQLRSVSNYVGERNKQKWQIKESVINLNNELIRLLESL